MGNTGKPPAVNDLDSFWMPFTANRQFKGAPRMLTGADGMYYRSADGRDILDGTAGLWSVNAGHNRTEIVEAIRHQAGHLDYAPAFQMGHPTAFEFAARLATMLPGDLNRIFFTNSGSESCDTALKIALAYHRARGEGHRQVLIGRERGYHGVGFGGISVGGIPANRKAFGTLLSRVDHLPHTHDLEHNAFSRGQPEWGAHLADVLERRVALHDPSMVAAVIVEPMAGSTGVLIPPKDYLERLRAICDRHGILLIFDEVITGFGRLGAFTASDYFGIQPDLMTLAKGLTNSAVPMGAVAARQGIYDAFMGGPDHLIELFHGYTYSGHPLAAAAGLATLDIHAREGLSERAASLAGYWEDALHSLADAPHVIDVRNLGLIGGIELEPRPDEPSKRAFETFIRCFEDEGVLIRTTGDIIALSPPLIIDKPQIDRLVDAVGTVLKKVN